MNMKRNINLGLALPAPKCKKCDEHKTVVRTPGRVMTFCRNCDNI